MFLRETPNLLTNFAIWIEAGDFYGQAHQHTGTLNKYIFEILDIVVDQVTAVVVLKKNKK